MNKKSLKTTLLFTFVPSVIFTPLIFSSKCNNTKPTFHPLISLKTNATLNNLIPSDFVISNLDEQYELKITNINFDISKNQIIIKYDILGKISHKVLSSSSMSLTINQLQPENPQNPGGGGSNINPIIPGGEEEENPQNPYTPPTPIPNPGIPVSVKYDASNEYYKEADGLKGQELFKKLFNIQQKYRHSIGNYSDLYKTYETSFIDKYLENDGTILDIYSEDPNGPDPYNFNIGNYEGTGGHGTGLPSNGEGAMYNREHMIPQSWFNKVNPTRNDAHFVWPSDKAVNNWRGNFPHFKVSNPNRTTKNGTKISNKYCEPIDWFKGDTARAYFYFQITHKNGYSGAGSQVFDNAFPYFHKEFLDCYYEWSEFDPVNLVEIERNKAIAEAQGGIRNPFIDYPDLYKLIWGNGTETFKNKGVAIGIN
ncbi:endonuclease [Metamycoplasma hyosynoviae]|uniref:endonuclease n=1 Tax=Metamycoplasma hyosynoviae TaxID=29559 RepID=UPI0023596D34|nr:endonuclease [Metamycoplasma hyosynoviae]MDC8937443.1 endonuclease [Metamycoplasma hyosynoviae]